MDRFMRDSPGSGKILIPTHSGALRVDQVEPRAREVFYPHLGLKILLDGQGTAVWPFSSCLLGFVLHQTLHEGVGILGQLKVRVDCKNFILHYCHHHQMICELRTSKLDHSPK